MGRVNCFCFSCLPFYAEEFNARFGSREAHEAWKQEQAAYYRSQQEASTREELVREEKYRELEADLQAQQQAVRKPRSHGMPPPPAHAPVQQQVAASSASARMPSVSALASQSVRKDQIHQRAVGSTTAFLDMLQEEEKREPVLSDARREEVRNLPTLVGAIRLIILSH